MNCWGDYDRSSSSPEKTSLLKTPWNFWIWNRIHSFTESETVRWGNPQAPSPKLEVGGCRGRKIGVFCVFANLIKHFSHTRKLREACSNGEVECIYDKQCCEKCAKSGLQKYSIRLVSCIKNKNTPRIKTLQVQLICEIEERIMASPRNLTWILNPRLWLIELWCLEWMDLLLSNGTKKGKKRLGECSSVNYGSCNYG